MNRELNTEILTALGNRPELAFPHTIGQMLDGTYVPFFYQREISTKIAPLLIQGNARIGEALIPRGGKTTGLEHVMEWHLSIRPSERIIFASYSEDFARERVRRVRNAILENPQVLGIQLSPDSQSAEAFDTIQGGGVLGVGVGSGLLGRAANLLILDDIYPSWEKAQNPKERHKVVQWFLGTAYSRLEPRASIIVCQARFHINDLIGYLINEHSDEWTLLSYPAISPEGEPLCPQRYDKAALKRIRDSIGKEKFLAQYQQSPPHEAEAGAQMVFPNNLIKEIKKSHLPPFTNTEPHEANKRVIRYIGFDPGQKNSYSAFVVIERVETDDVDNPELHVIHLQRYPLGTKIHRIARDLNEFSLSPQFGELAPIFVVDASGAGGGMAVEILERQRISPIIPLAITSRGSTKNKFTVLKADLVEIFRDLISENRLRISEGLPNSKLILDELKSYRARESPQGRSVTYRPAGSSTDDLLDSLMLACYASEQNWIPLFARSAPGLHGTTRRRPISGNRGDVSENFRRSAYAEAHPDYARLRGWIS